MLIRVQNNLTALAQPTYMGTATPAGASSFWVRNINGFNASYAIQMGATGENTSEIALLTSSTPSGTVFNTTTSTLYDHAADTPVFPIKFDKIIVYRSTSGTTGTATALGTIAINPAGSVTTYDDTTAQATYGYQTAFYNSVTGETSQLSDWITPSGFVFYSLAAMRQRVKDKLWDARFIQNDLVIDNWINEWYEKMSNQAMKVNQDYMMGSTNVTFSGTSDQGSITVQDFKTARRVWMTTDGVSWYEATKMSVMEFLPQQTFDASEPYFFFYGDNVMGRRPNDVSATAAVVYYQMQTPLQNDGDTLPLSLRSYTQSFVDYAYAHALLKDNLQQAAVAPLQAAQAGMAAFISEMTPRAQTGPSRALFEDFVTGDDFEMI